VPGRSGLARAATLAAGRGAIVRGVLATAAGRPLGGRTVRVATRVATPGAAARTTAVARTDRTGRFAVRVPAGPNRRIEARWAGDARTLPADAGVTLRTPASTSLRVAPRDVRVGQTATFSGRLRGGHVPRAGTLVIMQARVPSRGWQTFAAVRTGPDGRWVARYRFRATIGTVVYRLRAVVPTDAAYPFVRGASAVARITAHG